MESLWRSWWCIHWCTRWCADDDEEGEPVVTTGDIGNEQPRRDDGRLKNLEIERLQRELAECKEQLRNQMRRNNGEVTYSTTYRTEEQEEADAMSANVTGMPEQENREGSRRVPTIEKLAHTINIYPDDCYKMDYKNRGTCLVFYHRNYKNERVTPVRVGAKNELRAVERTFVKLGFKLDVHKDRTYRQIRKVLENLKTKDFSEDDCISIIVMSHGGNNDTIWAYDNEYPKEIFEKTLSQIDQLKQKPKLIFVQACRGQKVDKGIKLGESKLKILDKADCFDGSIQPRKCPSGAEFYIVQSALPGYRSWRNWFLPILCTVFDKYSDAEDIHSILRRTNQLIAEKESSCDDVKLDKAKQILTICHNLTKTLFLKSEQTGVRNII